MPFQSAGFIPATSHTRAGSTRRALAISSVGLFHVHDFAAFIKTTLRADAVLHARFLTIWTSDGLRCPQGIVRSAFAAARF